MQVEQMGTLGTGGHRQMLGLARLADAVRPMLVLRGRLGAAHVGAAPGTDEGEQSLHFSTVRSFALGRVGGSFQ